MFQLNNLTPLVKKRKRVGRGGSRGGTSGKGYKGQKQRSGGYVARGFEGGQMPLSRRLPKRGFNNTRFKTEYSIVSLETLEKFFNENDIVDKIQLIEKGVIKKNHPLKILGGSKLNKKLNITADAFSASAIDAINSVGGKVQFTKEM